MVVMELCLLNFLILIDCFFVCNSYSCELFESFSHVINQKSHVYSWNLGKIYLVHFLKCWNSLLSLVKFQNFKKVNSVNLYQILLLNMWLLVQIVSFTEKFSLRSTVLYLNTFLPIVPFWFPWKHEKILGKKG